MKNNSAESRIAERLEHLQKLVDEATGRLSGRARFYGFVLNPWLKNLIASAVEFFRKGELNHADIAIGRALAGLDQTQRKFCAGSIEHYFNRLILDLPHLDEDIEAGILRKKEAFAEVATEVGKGQGDLEKASELSWALRDAIIRAPQEQEARLRNRAERALKGKTKAREARWASEAEKARGGQLKAIEEAARRRSEFADKLLSELSLQ